jgi:hypothetical protein
MRKCMNGQACAVPVSYPLRLLYLAGRSSAAPPSLRNEHSKRSPRSGCAERVRRIAPPGRDRLSRVARFHFLEVRLQMHAEII